MMDRSGPAQLWFRRGVEHYRAGDFAQARHCLHTAIRADDQFADAHHLLGLIALRTADAAAALPHFLRATELDPGKAAHFLNLGVALRQLQRHTEAIVAYDHALRLEPRSSIAFNNRGNSRRDLDDDRGALVDYDRAVAVQPDYAEAHRNRGVLLQKLGRLDEALAALAEAIRLQPDYAEAYNNRGNVLRDQGQWDEAGREYDRALAAAAKAPGTTAAVVADAYYNRAAVLRDQGAAAASATDLRAALVLRPEFPQARWALMLSGLTPVYDSVADMAAGRQLFVHELQSLVMACEAEPTRLADWEPAVGASQPFYLAYHGSNERESLSKYGALACTIMAAWQDRQLPPATPAIPGRLKNRRLRVGFVSAQVHRHSVWDIVTRGWLTRLDREQFDVYCYHLGWRQDRETAVARSAAGHFVMGPRSLAAWVETIRGDAPDVLIYPEIGMEPMTAKLAALRLAPVQCAAWGHPLTTGLPSMDYFLSAELLEPEDAQNHYAERLVRLPRLGCYVEPLWNSGAQAGLAATLAPDIADAPRFICCQQVAKYHPDFDGIFVEIAKQLGRCRFTFVELARTHTAWERFRQRLGRAFAARGLDIHDFCTFLPTLPRTEFLALLRQQDVYLDTPAFSGFTTAIQALSCGLPVVTLAGDLMRKRLAAGILLRIGVTETVTADVNDYIEVAVRLGRDGGRRSHLRERILANLESVYRDEAVVRALEEFLHTATPAPAPSRR